MNKWFKSGQLWQLIKALFKEIIREPGVLFWGILFPILMSLGLGLAFTKKADVIRKVAVILSNVSDTSERSLHVVGSFLENNCEKNDVSDKKPYQWELSLKNDKLGNSVFYFYEMDWEQAIVLLKRGTINVVVLENDGEPEYHFDPQNSDAQLTYIKLNSLIGKGKAFPSETTANVKPLTVKGTRYIDFLVPGLITMGVMMSCMWGISYGLIEKRSKKLLRRLVATPMKKSHFLFAQITVRILMNFVESLTLLIFAVIAFKMTIQGDIAALLIMFLAGNFAFAGIAIFVSSHTSNTEVGNGLINAIVFPMMVLSGIFFSYHNFPDWSIKVIQALPLTMLTDGIRSIFNEGAGFREVAMPIVILTAVGAVFFTSGLKIFKWH
ncbi:MAG: ABC transporter permease [Bacteroidales bacterium]